jgi:hypothetical protein
MAKWTSELAHKLAARRMADRIAGPGWVLETAAGRGEVWDRCWRGRAGLALDLSREAVTAASLREQWVAARVDAARLLESVPVGWLDAFAVVDCDVYGSPWRYLAAIDRVEYGGVVVMTDGYRSRASVGAPCRALFAHGTRPARMSCAQYVGIVEARFPTWSLVRLGGRKMDHWVGRRG